MSGFGVAEARSPDTDPRPPAVARNPGLDLARALAIVGMVMVHVGPARMPGGGLAGEAYRISHGRASILFVLVAGIGISLLARGRTGAGEGARGWRSTVLRLAWRSLLLLPLGLALQELETGVAVILQYYAMFFLIAIVALRLPDRVLLGLVGAMSVLGPLAVLYARRSQPEWFGPIPEWFDFGSVARDLIVSGTYPMLVWVVPLLLGIWLGRQDLRSRAASAKLLLGGAGLAAAAFGSRFWLESVAGTPTSRADWLQLAAIEPHNEMPLWVLSSTGIAVAIVGGAILLAGLAGRALWPLVGMGQLALTIYVAHLVVLWQRPEWLRRGEFGEAWEVVGIFTLVVLALAGVWRVYASRGPLETVFDLPWWWVRRRRAAGRAEPTVRAEFPEAAPSSS